MQVIDRDKIIAGGDNRSATAITKAVRRPSDFAHFAADQNATGEYRLAEIVRLWRGLHLRWARAA